MHKNAIGHTREEIIQQVKDKEPSVCDYASYVPIGMASGKLANWKNQGAEIVYLTSRREPNEIKDVQNTFQKHGFPEGQLMFRNDSEEYKDIVERVMPNVLIEDDCESIGGRNEMTITHVKPEVKRMIKSIVIKEFGGIDHLPDKISELSYITA